MSSYPTQFDLFEKDDVKLLMLEMARVRNSADSVRRSIYAEMSEIRKENKELKQVVDLLMQKYLNLE